MTSKKPFFDVVSGHHYLTWGGDVGVTPLRRQSMTLEIIHAQRRSFSVSAKVLSMFYFQRSSWRGYFWRQEIFCQRFLYFFWRTTVSVIPIILVVILWLRGLSIVFIHGCWSMGLSILVVILWFKGFIYLYYEAPAQVSDRQEYQQELENQEESKQHTSSESIVTTSSNW